jgi:hypothetical protein
MTFCYRYDQRTASSAEAVGAAEIAMIESSFGRRPIGATAQLLQASEAEQMAAVMQTVPDIDGTEIILETTAYGFKGVSQALAEG